MQAAIITTHRDTIVVVNGTANGYRIEYEPIRRKVRQSSVRIPYVHSILRLLADVRPYVFIIPPPYLPASNASDNETYEWKIDDDDDEQKLNDTDDDDDSVKKRIVLLTHIYLYVVDPLIIYSCISFTFSVVSFCALHGDSCRSIPLVDKEQRENHHIARSVIVNGLSIETKFFFTLSRCKTCQSRSALHTSIGSSPCSYVLVHSLGSCAVTRTRSDSSITPILLSLGKPVHTVQLLLADRMYHLRGEAQTFEFYGPPHPEDPQGPTLWTRPYYDCGRSNKWVISSVSPIVDVYPRHTEYRHMQAMRNLAVAVAEIDFIMLDINQCAEAEPLEQPNLFSGTDKCKSTTRCEPLTGFGFRRGGYQCLCQPGFRYPPYQDGPFQGFIIEKATLEEYIHNFDCLKVERTLP